MLKNKSGGPLLFVGAVRPVHATGLTVWVVNPKGERQPLSLTVGVCPPQLDVEWLMDGETVVGIKTVSMTGGYERKGWHLLYDLYEAEGRLGDYDTFLEYVRQCQEEGVKDEIPDVYLPRRLLALRKDAKEKEGKPQLPPPQEKKGKDAA